MLPVDFRGAVSYSYSEAVSTLYVSLAPVRIVESYVCPALLTLLYLDTYNSSKPREVWTSSL